MVIPGRRTSITFFILLGAGVVTSILLLYVGWVLLNWRTGLPLVFGILLLLLMIGGVALNTIYLVREIQRNAQHDAFINAVTHELKTPVASIRLYLETLQRHDIDPAKRSQFYRTMLEDSERLLATIEQVLRAGRVSPLRRKLNLVPLELNALVESCLERVRTLHQLPADCFEQHPGPAVQVLGDAEELQAAVSNLIDNAVKYSGRNFPISVETDCPSPRVATLRVRDRGIGIPKHELKQVFKRFYRVPGARVKGTGLGLYIVRSVAKRHGGRVWAESDGPGRGATFVLELPIAS